MVEFLIADSFTDSLTKLTGDEQKAVKTTAFDLQLDPVNNGMALHRIERAKDKNFWSVRANDDIRLIVHRTESSILLCYAAHHDKAYEWAERRKLETHPVTGAAQMVELRERVEDVIVPRYVEAAAKPLQPAFPLFAFLPEEQLLGYGVPPEWIDAVRAADENTILELADHLPAEAAEALLELATGGVPQVVPHQPVADPFQHPDAQRRFRAMHDADELERALDYPWEKWTVFLHHAQHELVERNYNGPARVAGSAGTGKTIVALHRAVYLAKQNPDARVLLTTFSQALANALRVKLRRLISNEPRLAERLEVHSLDSLGRRLYELHIGKVETASSAIIHELLIGEASKSDGPKLSGYFLHTEWDQVVDAWQLQNWEEYRDVARLGRKTRLGEPQRARLWSIFERTQAALADRKLTTTAAMFTQLAQRLSGGTPPFEFAVIDEAQDVSVAQLRFLAALGGGRPNSLFFAGDLGQRIFQQPFSWKSLGVDIRGRSRSLRINYRTSHQIRTQADRLLGPEVSDVDGNTEERKGTVSAFNGPPPLISTFDNPEAESEGVGKWIRGLVKEGVTPHEIAIFVRSEAELDRARAAADSADITYRVLDASLESTSGSASICTMHLAKGLEFRVVAVMGCDDEVIPLLERIAAVTDESDLQDVYETERHLLYVACTRARDHLLVTSGDVPSEFLDDLRG